MRGVTRVPPFDRAATCEDLAQLPDNVVGEIIDGELHTNPRPAPVVAATAIALGGMLLRGLAAGSGRDHWQIVSGPELRLGADVFFPGLAGWRVSRLPQLPAAPYFSVAPDWVCEIVSSSAASLRARKMASYAGWGVSHAWLIDTVTHTLDVRRLTAGRWVPVATYVEGQLVRAEPFEGLDLPLAALWPR